ncbi:helicase-related protein [Spirulina sp. CCNP1310]|uniref:helicase-related protein n=1 Tax=Spirulina sp. CCNP1310 TaxID=3110249 RepID=UPI002B207182|nr:helicase-related protein [Spirulina sp. CCNP1310]MEA5418870.1 helicase-related protein [Spirulina sp. CCNP1310]
MKSEISADLGRLFEVGFNVGLLTGIKQSKLQQSYGNLYQKDLQQLRFSSMIKTLLRQVTSSQEKAVLEKWSQFFLLRGFLAGLNFWREYLEFVFPTGKSEVEVVYLQCCFRGDNSLGQNTEEGETWERDVLQQFSDLLSVDSLISRYKKTGGFLKADTLLLLRSKKGRRVNYRMVCVDLSAFVAQFSPQGEDLGFVEIIKNLLWREINYFRSKSVFSQLRLDTSCLDYSLSDSLRSYFNAFQSSDKEMVKLIQAGSYAYSFYEFLCETEIINPEDLRISMLFNIIGYTNRGLSSVCVNPKQQESQKFLATCQTIYQQRQKDRGMEQSRQDVLNKIKRSVSRSFEGGKDFVNKLLKIAPNAKTCVEHREIITGFANSVGVVSSELREKLELPEGINLQDAHQTLVVRSLSPNNPHSFLFLTGNPGIGKTTAIAKFLQDHAEEGFLFLYASPRKQVNLDILEKFKNPQTQQLVHDGVFTLNSCANLIKNNYNHSTVQYQSNTSQGHFQEAGIYFQDSRLEDNGRNRRVPLQRIDQNTITPAKQGSAGVLQSVCKAIALLVDRQVSRQIVATVSIQSLKKTATGDTLTHLNEIFKSAYRENERKVFPDKMRQISQKIKHLIIMIDEITGDDGGVAFLQGIEDFIKKYGLTDPQYGFNCKVIVADASLVDATVINKHLTKTKSEPDKIYFRHCQNAPESIVWQPFTFKHYPAILINTNAYPAKSLSLTYKVFVQSYGFHESTNLRKKYEKQLEEEESEQIFMDLKILLVDPEVEQVIVYIQNKRKLKILIDRLTQVLPQFTKKQDYLEVHADIAEPEKQQIEQYKNQVRVIFMTASGSRGLSFPKARHILVEIPRFFIEKNLMEIIQVIYRGRGDRTIDQQDKFLTFYVTERAIYYTEDVQSSLHKSILNLFNILLLLKAAILTRIYGVSPIGSDQFLIIPIGGKSMSGAGQTFSNQLASLNDKLAKEMKKNPGDVVLKEILDNLKSLLSSTDFKLHHDIPNLSNDIAQNRLSYLQLNQDFAEQFIKPLQGKTLDHLLEFNCLDLGYLTGSLLIVPLAKKVVEENYLLRLHNILRCQDDRLLKLMKGVSHREEYGDELKEQMVNAVQLIESVRDCEQSQQFQERSQRLERYYAIPLFVFIVGDILEQYFQEKAETSEEGSFREILAEYVRSIYPVDSSILPIGYQYQKFPFVVFDSYSLEEIRQQAFVEQYLLNSPTLNILSLILSKSGDISGLEER